MDKFLTPWPHFIIQQTFPPADFVKIQKIMSGWPKPDEGHRFREDIQKFSNSGFILNKLRKHVYPMLIEAAASSYSSNVLKNRVVFKSEYNCQSKDNEYPIHIDVESKLVSIITHISNDGTGTSLYNSDKTFNQTLPWIPNSSLMFANGHKYHSFKSNHNYRVTLASSLQIDNDS